MSASRKWSPLIVPLLALAVSLYAWPRLPERVPTHFGVGGAPDGWGSRAMGALLMPAVMAFIVGVFRVLPAIDPRRENWAKMRGFVDAMLWSVLLLMLALHVAIIAYALGAPVNIDAVGRGGIGVLFIVLGVLLPRAQPNWFVGIRTPWTLSNDRVWARTHRVGGRLFVAAGVVLLASPLLGGMRDTFFLLPVSVGVAALGTVAYSYVAWRQETRRGV